MDVQEAAAALAAIEEQQQQQFVTAQLDKYRWHHPALGLVLGLAAASLMWRNLAWFIVVFVLFLYGALRVIGTPARLGVMPRNDGPGFSIRLVASLAVAITAPGLAMVGPRWVPLAVGGCVAVIVPTLGWWKLAAMRADAARPPRTEPTRWSRLVTRVAPSPLYPPVLAALMGAAVAVTGLHPYISLVAALAYIPGLFLLQGVSMKIGEIPADRRPTPGRQRAVEALYSIAERRAGAARCGHD